MVRSFWSWRWRERQREENVVRHGQFDQRVQNANWELVAAERTTQTNGRESLVYHQHHHVFSTFLMVGTKQLWRQICFVSPPSPSITSGLSPRLWCFLWTPRVRVERQSEMFLCISGLVSSCSDMPMTVKVIYMFNIPSGNFFLGLLSTCKQHQATKPAVLKSSGDWTSVCTLKQNCVVFLL